MKRVIISFVVALLLITLISPVSAKADVIWEPRDDFFEENGIKADVEQRYYIANSPKGYIFVYKRPDTLDTARSLSNGEQFFVYYKFSYKGKNWGMSAAEEYILLEDTYIKYDHVSFSEEYKDKIDFVPDDKDCSLKKDYICMNYPGADTFDRVGIDSDDSGMASAMFVDEDGQEWLFYGYYYGKRNFWVCISDPYKTDHKIREIDVPETYPGVEPTAEEIKKAAKDENPTGTLGSIKGRLVVVACICTAALIAVSAYLITRKVKKDE